MRRAHQTSVSTPAVSAWLFSCARRAGVGQVAHDGGQQAAHVPAAAEVAGEAAHEVVGERLHVHAEALARPRLYRGAFPRGHGVERRQRPAGGDAPRDLRRPEDPAVVGDVREPLRAGRGVRAARSLRLPPDAPRVEEARVRDVVAEEAAHAPVREEAPALDEEGPPLLEVGLERRQVHDRRVHLHLAEVGVHRAGQREVRRQQVLEVGAHPGVVLARMAEGIGGRDRRVVRRAPDDVREELGLARAHGRCGAPRDGGTAAARRPR